jgi:hypothetical protein
MPHTGCGLLRLLTAENKNVCKMATVRKRMQCVHSFAGGKANDNELMKNLGAGKGANLAENSRARTRQKLCLLPNLE